MRFPPPPITYLTPRTEIQHAMETTPDPVETAPTPTKTLDEHIADALATAPKPLNFGAVRKALKVAGVAIKGKGKIPQAEIQSAIDSAIAGGHAFAHPHKTPEGPQSYWRKPYVSKAELAEEKTRVLEAKAAEKARAKANKAEEKSGAKAAKVEEKSNRKAGAAAESSRQKVAAVVESVRRKAAELGKRVVTDKQLGLPKEKASPAEQEAFRTTLAELISEGKLFAHGEKYGSQAQYVPTWYDTKPLKKPFEEVVRATRTIVGSGTVEFEDFLKALLAKLDEKPTEIARADEPVTPPPGDPL